MSFHPYSVPFHTRIIRGILRPLFRSVLSIVSRVNISGMENIPDKGAYLIVFNHVSLFEVPMILAFWPTTPEAVGAVDLWSRPGQSILARLYRGIPLRRGEYDRKVIETMLHVVKSGFPLLIAPEGGRSHSPGMRRALPGAAYIIDAAKVPVVPVGISGATDDFLSLALKGKRPPIRMRVGAPITLPAIQGQGKDRRIQRQKNADQIMYKITELIPPEYHGVYGSEILEETDRKFSGDLRNEN